MTLNGKTVLVTGGSKGIGRAIVEAMVLQGANVVLNYSDDNKAVEETIKAIGHEATKVFAIKADITNQEEVDLMFTKIKDKFSRLDVLVNNAGIFDESDDPDNLSAFESVFRTNFLAQIRVTSRARELMSKGKIVFMSSVHGKLGHGRPSAIAYSSMKAALESYMMNLAKDLAPNVLVNAIAPGKTLTPQWGDPGRGLYG